MQKLTLLTMILGLSLTMPAQSPRLTQIVRGVVIDKTSEATWGSDSAGNQR
ncbi:hypothetical protein Q4E93_29260 [Flavitalea sp. BT771]|uniref:hypothetical protein n=1 Tax=Flavitalea sp. BT771 TaxID=3063329 RepID=UPI0026E3EB70|nr:hypothetical protein [Flavitalea sp. BT771]MDO6434736.1 hypothetical protein [Flavitalea sp. BT771]MDV6223636.1 hypothetical protein [Flavitalea sp. BT771]